MIDSSKSIETAKQDIQNAIKNNYDPDVAVYIWTTADDANRYELALQEMGLDYAIHKGALDVKFIIWGRKEK